MHGNNQNNRWFFAVAITVISAMTLLLTACNAGEKGQLSDTDTTSASVPADTVTVSETVTEPQTQTVLIENGASDYIVISPRAVSSEMTAVMRDFIAKLEKKSGVKLKLYPESYTETECEIVVGFVRAREQSVARMNEIGYTSWGVIREGKKFIVTAYDEEGVKMALNTLMAHIEEKDGKWVVTGDLDLTGTVKKHGSHNIPVCLSKNAAVGGIYHCGEESLEVCLRAVTGEEYDAYGKTLTDAGWVKYTDNRMANNLFATYTHAADGKTIHLGYYPTLQNGTLRIISEPTGYLPATEAAAYTRVTETTFTQIGRKAVDINSAPGMSYIMQLADGSFIIIDGGPANADDEAALFEYLKSLTPAGQKPTVAAWFITHAHSDHMALANRFLVNYHTQIDVKMAAYNFPNYEAVVDAKDVAGVASKYTPMIEQFQKNISQYWPDAEHFVIHAGQKLYLADAEIEILFTHEDLFPGEFTWVNHTSLAFRITAGGKNVMILGDCEKSLCQQMSDTFSTYLKSDMLQLTHHGANGACIDLYRNIDPAICFWACSQSKYESDERMLGVKAGYDFNAYLRDTTIRVREHYHSGTTTVIPMS